MFHLLVGGPSGMVFEHLQDYFEPEDLTHGFIQFHQLCSHVAMGRIPRFVVQVLGVSRLLSLVKPFSGIHPIVVEKVFYWLVSKDLCLQFHDVFAFHLSPYQFGVVVKSDCEVMVYGIWATMDAHSN
jgi:hypothetical protein